VGSITVMVGSEAQGKGDAEEGGAVATLEDGMISVVASCVSMRKGEGVGIVWWVWVGAQSGQASRMKMWGGKRGIA